MKLKLFYLVVLAISLLGCKKTSLSSEITPEQNSLTQKLSSFDLSYYEEFGVLESCPENYLPHIENSGADMLFLLHPYVISDETSTIEIYCFEDPLLKEEFEQQNFNKKLKESNSQSGSAFVTCTGAGTTCKWIKDQQGNPEILCATNQ